MGWEQEQQIRRRKYAREGLYRPEHERESCGVGFVAAIDGKSSRDILDKGLAALKAVWHRGAVDADGKTGDGAGIHFQISRKFFADQIRRTGHKSEEGEHIGVGQIFLPRDDLEARETCRTIVETELRASGCRIYGWRQVPVDASVLGAKANATRPEIEQILVGKSGDIEPEDFERQLYVNRRHMEAAAVREQIDNFYVCSLSCRSVIYKGMMLAQEIADFYPDLLDERMQTNFALFHQRYSTNTFPRWRLAQPFRTLAHNGEINTLRGNINWMRCHEIRMSHQLLGQEADDIKPIIGNGSSDSAALDAVFEIMVRTGRSAPMAKTILVPESWSKRGTTMPDSWRAMYAYSNAVMEPWDGPAAIAATDGRWILGGLDRNGLRPLRYSVTDDGILVAGSEIGMVHLEEASQVEKGCVGPGQMIAVDLEQGKLYYDAEIKNMLAESQPFAEWTEKIVHLDETIAVSPKPSKMPTEELRSRQIAAGYSVEKLESFLHPMAVNSKEAIGSMGDDTPLTVLSDHYRPLSNYFRQNFSQVTNPPIDSLREYRVMSLKTRFANLKNVLEEDSGQTEILLLDSPVVSNRSFAKLRDAFGDSTVELDCTFSVDEDEDAVEKRLELLRAEAEAAVSGGVAHVILSDRNSDEQRAAMPMLLVTSAIHSWLLERGLRTYCSINVCAADCIDPHDFAVLIGCGATTVNAWLAEESITHRHARGLLEGLSLPQSIENYHEAIDQGILKILSKSGISVISSFRGGGIFEALGLSRSMIASYFPGVQSRISGIGLKRIHENILRVHRLAYRQESILPIGGFHKFRASGEHHAWSGEAIHALQNACESGAYHDFRTYLDIIGSAPPIQLRDLLEFKPLFEPIPVDQVESVTSIRKRLVTPGMSLGALSPEAHEALNVAMNRIGAKSDSGEGGEDPEKSLPSDSGDNRAAKIKQIASGRFGVTAQYLNACDEIEIKIAQGAKPGEGGQLMGTKVTDMIARLRHSTKGVSLISPPPHHDIYSIEDLAQLIYDLKQINPLAKVCVKLVAATGVGTIAAGVAKAKADVILISGHNGGTGASPITSIKCAGLPWEMGLTEAHQVLALNNLRDRVSLRTDGGLRSGRDIVMAAMMGAEEFGFGTAALVAMGCLMVRQCQANTCPVGICTQDEDLRRRLVANASDRVVNLFGFIAHEVREILSSLGVRSLEEVIGRADMLAQLGHGVEHYDDLDLNPLLMRVEEGRDLDYSLGKKRNEVDDSLDMRVIDDAEPFFAKGEKMSLTYSVVNTDRSVGARLSSEIVRKLPKRESLQSDHLTLRLVGTAGQSLGAFAVHGLRIFVYGAANDYVGKGLSGASIIVRPHVEVERETHDDTIIGNTVLYGATEGELFAAGRAGERFAVRNSGVNTVVEGCGSNGCEYMTGGVAILLGSVGDNFAAGMTGGMAFIYDEENMAEERVNQDSVIIHPLASEYWTNLLHSLVERHVTLTGSLFGQQILHSWPEKKKLFKQICPKEMLQRLPHPLSDKEARAKAV